MSKPPNPACTLTFQADTVQTISTNQACKTATNHLQIATNRLTAHFYQRNMPVVQVCTAQAAIKFIVTPQQNRSKFVANDQANPTSLLRKTVSNAAAPGTTTTNGRYDERCAERAAWGPLPPHRAALAGLPRRRARQRRLSRPKRAANHPKHLHRLPKQPARPTGPQRGRLAPRRARQRRLPRAQPDHPVPRKRPAVHRPPAGRRRPVLLVRAHRRQHQPHPRQPHPGHRRPQRRVQTPATWYQKCQWWCQHPL